MKKYEVRVYEVWSRTFVVEAENKREAAEKANELLEDGGDEGLFEYHDTRDIEDWYVQEAE